MFLTFFVFSFVNTRMDILESFGYTEHYNIIALTVFMEIYKPVSKVITFIHFYITWTCEFQADAYAKWLGYQEQLIFGLIWLFLKNKGNLNPDPLYAAYHNTHPSLLERLSALDYKGEEINLPVIEEKTE